MNDTLSAFPDQLLRLTQILPWPLNSAAFNILRRRFEARGRADNSQTRIRFGSVEIVAPLAHPAVYWRYRPVGFNRNFVEVVRCLLKSRNGLLIDVGANIGDGIALLRGEGIQVPVLAVEGASVWFELLKENTKELDHVWLENALLGTSESQQPVELYVHDGTSQLVKSETGVKITTLDAVIQRHSQYPVALVKTDTDGFDLKVLKGAQELLARQKPVVFAEVDDGLMAEQGDRAQEFVSYFLNRGYSWIAVWDNWGRWLGNRSLNEGIEDFIIRCPGGFNKPYLDVAIFADQDRRTYQAVASHYERSV